MAYTQEHRMIRITTPLGGDELLVTGLRGHEEISRLFRFELTLLSHNHSIDFKKVIGGNVTVALLLENGEERFFNGLVASFAQSNAFIKTGQDDHVFSEYKAILVPWLWFLTKTTDLRIFQNKSAIDIIEQVFSEKGLSDYAKKLSGSYSPRTYCVQYRESDFDFISRLMEEEGIAYYFSHEQGKHSLVLADAANAHTPCAHHESVRYLQSGLERGRTAFDEDTIQSLELRNDIQIGKVTLTDYNFESPRNNLRVEVDSREHFGPGEKEIYDYPGLYEKRNDGDALVRVRVQEEEWKLATVIGTGDVRGLASGYTFTLHDYFREEMNNKKYLLTRVDHTAQQAKFGTGDSGEMRYTNSFTCIPVDTPFRPVRLTAKPVVKGVQTAVVVGPAGEEIYTDKHGRIKVQFHWDREGKNNENSSCWMRVGQLWAGAGWGALYIPRIGQEVIVDFLEGDPDRPIVTGCVYNGTNMPPYSLPEGKTKSTIKSNSSKGGAGFNEIRFEDKKGEEEIYIHGEKDENIVIEHDKTQTVGHDESLQVGNDRTKAVGRDETIDIGRDETEAVGRNRRLSVGNNREENIGANHTESIGKELSLTVAGNSSMQVGKTYQVDIDQNHVEKVSKDYSLAAKKIVLEAQDQIEIKVGSASIIMKKSGDIQIKGAKLSIKGSGDITIKGSKVGIN